MAGLAAVTSRIQIYATAATLTLPRRSWRGWPPPSTPSPAGALALTRSPAGKAGVRADGDLAGDDYFSRRYDYLTEYVQVLHDLWGTGKAISKAISSP